MQFDALLSRADDYTLQQLLGAPTVRLVRLLSGETMGLDRLRQALLSLHSPAELFIDRGSREMLLDLLRPEEVALLAAAMGCQTGNTTRDLASLVSAQGQTKDRALLAYFGIPLPIKGDELSPPNRETLLASYPLFDHQRETLRQVREKIEIPPQRVLLHIPTGGGKTRVAMNAICDHLRARPQALVVWLAHSEELCEQACEEFSKAWGALGNRPTDLHRFWGGHQFTPSEVSDGLLVAGLPKLFSAARSRIEFIDELRQRVSLVVMDEAHQSIAETYRTLLDALLASPRTALLGLTATPGRTWNDPDEDAKLAKYFSRHKVTLSVPNQMNPVEYLVDRGYLARPTFTPVLYNSGIEISPEDLDRIRRHFDIPERVVRLLAADEQRNLAILRRIEGLVGHHRRVLVFAASVEHSMLLAAVLKARGINAHSVTGETQTADRAHLIEAFRSGSAETMVLCNFGVLTTGFDAPRTSAAVIARPTRSLVLYSQMIGRAIRGPMAGGNATAEILIVQDPQLPGFGSIEDAFMNWEDVWNE